MEKTELMQAFSWICNNCGRRNFERAIAVEMAEEEKEEFKRQAGIEPWQEGFIGGDWVQAPRYVVCEKCETEYETFEEWPGDEQEEI